MATPRNARLAGRWADLETAVAALERLDAATVPVLAAAGFSAARLEQVRGGKGRALDVWKVFRDCRSVD